MGGMPGAQQEHRLGLLCAWHTVGAKQRHELCQLATEGKGMSQRAAVLRPPRKPRGGIHYALRPELGLLDAEGERTACLCSRSSEPGGALGQVKTYKSAGTKGR